MAQRRIFLGACGVIGLPYRKRCWPLPMRLFNETPDVHCGLGSAAAWPLAARAQQGDRMRRIGVLMPFDENDPEGKIRYSAFIQALAGLGWTDGRNMRMDLRWGGGEINRIRALTQELVGLQPDIILPTSTPATAALHRETRTIPIPSSRPSARASERAICDTSSVWVSRARKWSPSWKTNT